MATEEEADNRKSEGGPGLGGSVVQSEERQKYRESVNPDGTKGNRKEISSGQSSRKVGGSRQGTQETKEGRNKDRTSPRNSEGVVSKKVRVTDARRKLAEIEKRTAKYKVRLMEEMMTGNEEGPLQEEPRDEWKTSRDYENLVVLLKWTEEEKMDHLGQHVSLSLGRDIIAIVAASRSWKETRDMMMRKYLATEKIATEADLVAVQRKNFATYNDFLREFTLVALRISGFTDRIMSKYFLRQFSEFDKDKILSAYQQTSKFVNNRDVDFSTVTDLAEKTVVTETLALLKEGEVIDLTGRAGDKVKKGIDCLHEQVHGVDNKIGRMEGALLVMQAEMSRPALPPQKAVVPPGVANRGFGRRDPANEQCKYCTAMGHYVHACPKLNHDILKRRCTKSLKGEIFGQQGERVNWNSPGGMWRAIIMLNGLEITVVEADLVGEIIWDQLQGRGPHVNFILENDGRDRVNATTRLGTVGRRINRDTVMEEVAGSSEPEAEPEAEEPEKVYGKPREEEPTDKVTAAKKKFRYQIPILSLPEIDDTISKLLGTMVSVSFQTMLQASPRLLKGLRQLLTRRRVEIGDNPELREGEREEEAPQEVANLQRSHGDLENLEKAFADTCLSLTDREGGEVMRMLVVARDMFPEKCEPYIDDNPIKVALSASCFNDEVGRPFILETDGGPLAVGGVLIQRDEGGKERPIRFESRTLNSAERRYSQFKKEVLAILHCLKTFHAYLFGRRFILRIDPTNVAGALKNYRPIDPTVGRWVGFIWQFDYKIERIAGIKNKADGLSRVCITPEGVEGAEPIDAFLEYEGGTLVVDNEMMSKECTSGELLIQTLEKGAPVVVEELREGSVTTRGRREEKDSWGAIVGPKEKLIAMAVEGGREAVMSLVESWERKELQWVVNQMREGKDGGQEREEFFYVQSYEGLFREIGLLLVGSKQPKEVSIKAREEAERYILDARDNLSGFVEAIALKKKTGRSVADWIKDFYLRHPFVGRFIADNGTEFVNQEVLGMLKRLCVPIKLIEPYHPEANAPMERGHRTLKNTIANLAADQLEMA
ncbi:hypothetical protein CBR_g12955 [Chara braunii]|uniref:Integrase catalytic domain-containing protein n=1 Tax=Chara braunii TaxID=69332 RepID=A0A388KT58_CHABU|nr:hypothetical protein CBR_g12955 [Chara braunii]|eukprot:GBG73237.1 hypothetical protein CBR_g12955 [Chara braunii]